MIHLVVSIKARPGKVDDFVRLIDRHARISKKEPGCLRFDVSRAGDTFLLDEVFASYVDLCAHKETIHYTAWRMALPELELEHRHEEFCIEACQLGYPPEAKVMTVELLRLELKDLIGKRVVFTNGVYSMCHRGVVHTLQWAREQGDVLVVGINDDASCGRLKGAGRPSLEDRAACVAALGCVDWVVPFAEDTPLALIETLKPHLVVKGPDYDERDVVSGGVPVLIAPPCAFTRHSTDLLRPA